MTIRLLAALVIVLLGSSVVHAQESLSKERPKPAPKKEVVVRNRKVMSVGLHASYGIMMNGVTAFRLPSIESCCPGYESTSGSGLVFGAEFLLPMSPTIDLGARLVYQSSSTDFSATEPLTVRAGNGTIQTGINHSLTTTTSFLMLEPVVSVKLAGEFAVLVGLRVGTTLGGTFEQQEALADPSLPYDFPTGSGLYNVAAADIPNVSGLQAGAIVGLRYAAPLANGLIIAPEVSYSPMFTDVITDAPWTIAPLRFGLNVIFDVMKQESVGTPIEP
ncbi:MAG: hypothetical protein RL594_876 [Bacteroidota bacterium]|jgi:hypothetical protein